MAQRIRLTRPELKKQREALKRFQRYLPMLKLRQSQLQMTLRQTEAQLAEARTVHAEATASWRRNERLLRDFPGIDVCGLSDPVRVVTRTEDIAGLAVPVLDHVVYPPLDYGLFGTPPWVDTAVAQRQAVTRAEAALRILEEQFRLIQYELRKTIQRVNLFEQVKIPEAKEAIRVIRIALGDEMTSAIGRSKIAKGRLTAQMLQEAASATIAPTDEEGGP